MTGGLDCDQPGDRSDFGERGGAYRRGAANRGGAAARLTDSHSRCHSHEELDTIYEEIVGGTGV